LEEEVERFFFDIGDGLGGRIWWGGGVEVEGWGGDFGGVGGGWYSGEVEW